MKPNRLLIVILTTSFLLLVISISSVIAQIEPVPIVDHHKHLISPDAAEWSSGSILPEIQLPEELHLLLHKRVELWGDTTALAELYTNQEFVKEDIAFFDESPEITPIAYRIDGDVALIVGYYSSDLENGVKQIDYVLIRLVEEGDGVWKIKAGPQRFPDPTAVESRNSDELIEEMQAAGLQRAVVLSVAYWFGSGFREHIDSDEFEMVRAENIWIAEQVARYPQRLVAFCSFNPLKEYALDELEHCAKNPNLKGLKLHFGNSQVDVRNNKHVEKLRKVFQEANKYKLPIAVHLWTGPEYEIKGREHAEIFLDHILPFAPDIPVQIAHFAGGGPGYTDSALEVYAEAISIDDPRTDNLYFDLSSVADHQPDEILKKLAKRIRQIGIDRIHWGTDNSPTPDQALNSWSIFRSTVPLRDEEFKAIAENVASYLR